MEVKQYFKLNYSNCHQNPRKFLSKHFWLIRWLQSSQVTKIKTTVNNFSENNSKLSHQTLYN